MPPGSDVNEVEWPRKPIVVLLHRGHYEGSIAWSTLTTKNYQYSGYRTTVLEVQALLKWDWSLGGYGDAGYLIQIERPVGAGWQTVQRAEMYITPEQLTGEQRRLFSLRVPITVPDVVHRREVRFEFRVSAGVHCPTPGPFTPSVQNVSLPVGPGYPDTYPWCRIDSRDFTAVFRPPTLKQAKEAVAKMRQNWLEHIDRLAVSLDEKRPKSRR